jgi:hypothetical protein
MVTDVLTTRMYLIVTSSSSCYILCKIIVTFGALQEIVNSMENKTKLELPDNVTDNEVINKLSEENEQLKVSIT